MASKIIRSNIFGLFLFVVWSIHVYILDKRLTTITATVNNITNESAAFLKKCEEKVEFVFISKWNTFYPYIIRVK